MTDEDDELMLILLHVTQRKGVTHDIRCKCMSCIKVRHIGNGWCGDCGDVWDGHKFMGEDRPVCKRGLSA